MIARTADGNISKTTGPFNLQASITMESFGIQAMMECVQWYHTRPNLHYASTVSVSSDQACIKHKPIEQTMNSWPTWSKLCVKIGISKKPTKHHAISTVTAVKETLTPLLDRLTTEPDVFPQQRHSPAPMKLQLIMIRLFHDI